MKNKIKRFFERKFETNMERGQAEKLLKGVNRYIEKDIEKMSKEHNYSILEYDEDFVMPIDAIMLLEDLDKGIENILHVYSYEDISEYLTSRLEYFIYQMSLYNSQAFQFYIDGLSIIKIEDYVPFKGTLEKYPELKKYYGLRLRIYTNLEKRDEAGYIED